MSNKTVLIATDTIYPRKDGISSILKQVIPFLENKFNLIVLCPEIGLKKESYFIEFKKGLITANDFNFSRVDIFKLYKQVKQSDIVFVQTLGPIGIYSTLIAKLLKKRVIYFMHVVDYEFIFNIIWPSYLSLRKPFLRLLNLLGHHHTKNLFSNTYDLFDAILLSSSFYPKKISPKLQKISTLDYFKCETNFKKIKYNTINNNKKISQIKIKSKNQTTLFDCCSNKLFCEKLFHSINNSGKTIIKIPIDLDTSRFKTKISAISYYKLRKALNIPINNYVLCYLGRIAKEKDLLTLKNAYLKLKEKYFNVTLLLIGDGVEEIKKQLLQNEKMNNIIITSFVDNVSDYLLISDFFVMPSLTETSSLSTLEAMYHSKCVISTNVGLLKKIIISNKNGLIFKKRNPDDLFSKLVLLINNPELQKSLSINAKKTISKNFVSDKMKNAILDILNCYLIK